MLVSGMVSCPVNSTDTQRDVFKIWPSSRRPVIIATPDEQLRDTTLEVSHMTKSLKSNITDEDDMSRTVLIPRWQVGFAVKVACGDT